MLFAETERLSLRTLDREELPRLVELLGEWEVVRWLIVVPHPYTMKDAEEFYADMEAAEAYGEPQFYALSLKSNGRLIGGIGLHPPRGANAALGEIEIGYWLGRGYWGRGLMSEAAKAVLSIGFDRASTNAIVATTSIANIASQNVLLKLGLRNQGIVPRDYKALRGDDLVVSWKLTREEWNASNAQ